LSICSKSWGYPKGGRAGWSGSQDQRSAITQRVKAMNKPFDPISFDWQPNMVGMDIDEFWLYCVTAVGTLITSAWSAFGDKRD
jgi:hypothetical protein